jgi:hypothetical protein
MKSKTHVRHIVLFKFKDNVSSEDVDQIVEAFTCLPKQIISIIGFESGINISPEKLNQGFTHGFVLTFATHESRDAYLVDPCHVEFTELLDGKLEQTLVFDFEVEN